MAEKTQILHYEAKVNLNGKKVWLKGTVQEILLQANVPSLTQLRVIEFRSAN